MPSSEDPVHVPDRPASLPRWGSPALRSVGHGLLRGMGWRFVGALPDGPRFVAIGAPHTSNWDFVVAMSALMALGLRVHWVGKHTLFRPPFGSFMRWLGGIPIDREATRGIVEQLVDAFEERDRFILGIAPEGTRSKVTRWKTGFYRIAQGAGVPILPVGIDWATRSIHLGDLFVPTGDREADMARLRAWFAPFVGKRPAKQG